MMFEWLSRRHIFTRVEPPELKWEYSEAPILPPNVDDTKSESSCREDFAQILERLDRIESILEEKYNASTGNR
jgi:hypothetical protein